jgi:hypothetical protein
MPWLLPAARIRRCREQAAFAAVEDDSPVHFERQRMCLTCSL